MFKTTDAECPGRPDILHDGKCQGTGAGGAHVPKGERAGMKTGLGKQRALASALEEKESLWTTDEGADHSGRLQMFHEALQEEN